MTNESHTDCYPALKTAISKLEDQKREIERLTRERDVSRAAIEQLHAAVKTAQELAARRLMEIERLQKRLDRINEKWPHVTEVERLRDALKRVRRVAAEGTTHTGMIAALGILVDRTLNPGNGPLPPDYTYRSDEPLQGASFPGQLGELYNAIAGYEKLSGYAPALLSAMRQLGASRDASSAWDCACNDPSCAYCGPRLSQRTNPADLVGALQDVVHTDPGPVRAGRAIREWHFERYRGGKLMAQGVKVHAPNYADAYEKAVTMLFTYGNKPTDELRLSERT